MKVDRERFEKIVASGGLIQGTWTPGENAACIMGALAGRSEEECVANGWPRWLVQLYEWANDSAEPEELVALARRLTDAAEAFNARQGDPDRLFRDLRLQAILPISMEAIGLGEESWRVGCRDVVQWCLDNDGEAAGMEQVVSAFSSAREAEAALAAKAIWAVGAGDAADAAWAAGAAAAALAAWAAAAWAAWAAEAAWAAWAAARARILNTLCSRMHGDAK